MTQPVIQWGKDVLRQWDAFWFTPLQPHTLAIIRIACGAMIAYVHLIWAIFATDFMGANGWINNATVRQLQSESFAWSWLWYIESPLLLQLHEIIAMLFGLAMMVGIATRFTTPIAWFLTLMTCHRMLGSLFGLDQIIIMLSMYLMLAPCGGVYSIDAFLRDHGFKFYWLSRSEPSIATNVATRLIQLHLCVIYIFGGLSKMRGNMWWDGSALWYSVVNYEYQSIDMTWLGRYPIIIATLTAATIFWETFYCAIVWPKLTRPIALGLAFAVHGGIALALGMITFGTIMIVANFAFISPDFFATSPTMAKRN
jgi:hypothetical protein